MFHTGGQLRITCNLCGVLFGSVRAMEVHLFRIHNLVEWNEEKEPLFSRKKAKIIDKRNTIRCKGCKKEIQRKSQQRYYCTECRGQKISDRKRGIKR